MQLFKFWLQSGVSTWFDMYPKFETAKLKADLLSFTHLS